MISGWKTFWLEQGGTRSLPTRPVHGLFSAEDIEAVARSTVGRVSAAAPSAPKSTESLGIVRAKHGRCVYGVSGVCRVFLGIFGSLSGVLGCVF